jgi:hypothetical protein
MVNTKHFIEERQSREELINNVIGDTNNVICTNVIDRGHINGAERFELSDKAIIRVYNNITNRHITDLIARPSQVYDRMGNAFLALPKATRDSIISQARKHQALGYNNK